MINIYNSNNVDKSKFDMIQNARRDLMQAIDAVIDYDTHAYNATDQTAITTWVQLKNKQLAGIGELMGMLMYLDPSQMEFVERGIKEFNDRLAYTKNGQQRNFNR